MNQHAKYLGQVIFFVYKLMSTHKHEWLPYLDH